MRRLLTAFAALALTAGALPTIAEAQSTRQQGQRQQEQSQSGQSSDNTPRFAPLRRQANAGPCPFVKILYDAARYVELADNRLSASAVGFTGEIEGVNSDCRYRESQPITVDVNMLFNLGRGPQAQAGQHTYRYWIAVTERNNAILAKEYFDLPVDFRGGQVVQVPQEQQIVIPRASATTSGGSFEILIGFDVTPEMAEFNRSGSRFRIDAGAANAERPAAQ
ncbi:Tat pathway signal sequence domain protein [Brevundimonas sp. S30B]|uniref:Tat pathway signal sequence domain protein n=1 Tax=unclassified Brevundimonas TaxID=2622653 RepID=UPI0010724009|nr:MULTISPECIES: Tat pathway signal sequence domain protein [unclassified Brevundimonas]QBX38573.1 Tat pathway signal sequence domain protein [Brevundimonas sp. MF30-B]TFW00477.1 Tat pathway signal sequence domain protein [Brevundimonas sp. S30B]TFW01876.1 Tat pathway signal sequence domain protein [Brevundimonas sp. S30B]